MPISGKDGKLTIELNQIDHLGQQLTDSGDHKKYTTATGHEFSEFVVGTGDSAVSRAPVIKPNGIKPGGGGVVSIAASGSNNVVDISAITDSYINNNDVTLAAQTDVTVARPTVSNYLVSSICLDYNAGTPQAVVIQGTEGSSFSTTRGAAGGPPLVDLDHVELAHVRYSSQTAAAVLGSEILSIPNQHREESSNPAAVADSLNGEVSFVTALMVNHTGSVAKNVYADTYEPVYAKVQFASDFVPTSTSLASTTDNTYDGAITTTSETRNDGSFTVYIDGTPDETVRQISGKTVHYKFYPVKSKTHFVRAIANVGVTESYPANAAITASVTLSPTSAEVYSSD